MSTETMTGQEMRKVVRIGTTRTPGGRGASVFCRIEYQNGRLSISGVIGPLASGNALGSSGQIDMEPWHISKYAPGWGFAKVAAFRAIWKRWHLNDMRAECEHQRARGETWNTHPMTVCPDCGYKLGSAWLHEDVPADVIEWLKALPDTDREPAWV